MTVPLKSSGRIFQCRDFGLNIPIGIVEMAVPEVARQQNQVVG